MQVPQAMLPLVRVWSHRNYACFMGGMTPALITLWMQRIGMLWLAWELTGENTWVGIIVAADYAPMLVMAPFVGAFVDRSDPVVIQKLTQWAILILSGLTALLVYAGVINIWLLLVVTVVLGCLHPFNAISRHAIVPNTVPKAEIPTALAMDSALYNAARFIGPALAGLLIVVAGVSFTFAANSIGCALYLVGLHVMKLQLPAKPERPHGDMFGGIVADVREGLTYVRGHPGIGPLFWMMTIGAIWVRPLQDLLPGFSAQVFAAGPSGLGWITAAMGVGATIAAGLIAMHGRVRGLTLAVLMGFVVNVAATLGFVATSSLWVAMPMAVIWGASLTMMSTATQALVQSSVDPALRGRVMSLYTMIYRGAPFLGALVVGAAADRIGLQLAFGVAAMFCVVPWLNGARQRAAITLSLEGRHNDFDQRMLATAKTQAGLAYEYFVDARLRVKQADIPARASDLKGWLQPIAATIAARLASVISALLGRSR